MTEKLIIIGSGPAGLSAAIYTAREGYGPLLIGGTSGGQLELTSVVENFPGFPGGINGPDLIEVMRKQAEEFGTRFIDEVVTAVDLDSKPMAVSIGEEVYYTESIIIATGANAKWLGIASEKQFIGRGVSSCATCDGPFFKGKKVIVVGGGDTAMEDSLFLTKFAESVTIVHRRDAFRASKVMQDRVLSNPKINVLWNTGIGEIKGDKVVRSVELKNLITGESSELPVDGVFVAIGYMPNTEIFKGKLDLDEAGYIITEDEVMVKKRGVFVAGDVSDRFYRQAVTASASGVKCALRVREYLSDFGE